MQKKLIIGCIGFLLMVVLLLMYFFPAHRVVGSIVQVNAPMPLVLRHLPDTSCWHQWWPVIRGNDPLLPGRHIRLAGFTDTQIVLNWTEGADTVQVIVQISPVQNHAAHLVWTAPLPVAQHPFARLSNYAKGNRLHNDMQQVLTAFALYAANPAETYGFEPVMEQVTDTLLITTRRQYSDSFTTAQLYSVIKDLETFAKQQGASASGNPMYHIGYNGKLLDVMIALPVNKMLPDQGAYVFKRMVDGNLLVANITGGPYRLKLLFNQLGMYMQDRQWVAPAIPYYQVLTNRLQVPDSNQWHTRLCHPVF